MYNFFFSFSVQREKKVNTSKSVGPQRDLYFLKNK